MYALAIPRRISLEGSGVVDRRIMLASGDERGDTRGKPRFFSRSMPKGETSLAPMLCLTSITSQEILDIVE